MHGGLCEYMDGVRLSWLQREGRVNHMTVGHTLSPTRSLAAWLRGRI